MKECRELVNNTKVKYVEVNGVAGALFTSKINGKAIFLPFSGARADYPEPGRKTGIYNRGNVASYMTANSSRVRHMQVNWWGASYWKNKDTGIVNFTSHCFGSNEGTEVTYLGLPIRAVFGEMVLEKAEKSGTAQKKGNQKQKKETKSGTKKETKSGTKKETKSAVKQETKSEKKKISKEDVKKAAGKFIKDILK